MERVFFEHNKDISNDMFLHLCERKLCFCLTCLVFFEVQTVHPMDPVSGFQS